MRAFVRLRINIVVGIGMGIIAGGSCVSLAQLSGCKDLHYSHSTSIDANYNVQQVFIARVLCISLSVQETVLVRCEGSTSVSQPPRF